MEDVKDNACFGFFCHYYWFVMTRDALINGRGRTGTERNIYMYNATRCNTL